MTLTDILLLIACLMSFRPCPKQGKIPKKRRKPIARKSSFHRYDNQFKTYKTDPPDIIRLKAERCRAEQIAANNLAELRLAAILNQLKVRFDYQVILYRPDAVNPKNYIVVDFIAKDYKAAIEVDGKCHDGRKKCDASRDIWLSGHGYRTLRVPAKDVFQARNPVLLKVKEWLNAGRI